MQLSWDNTWDDVFASRQWGKYPDLEVVRFVARNFYHMQPRNSVRLLEVGCGTGANVWYMAREGFSVSGVDGSQKALDILRQRLHAEKLHADVHAGDICQLPLTDGIFDGVIDCQCIYSNTKAHAVRILNEIHRVLKPCGIFLSLAFTPETWGHGCGLPLEGEERTFRRVDEGPLRGTGLARFASENDVHELYGTRFDIQSLETVRRSCGNRQKCIEEWVITCTRKAG